ncbi:MAG: phage holin family protein [Lentimicrobiaceae bacterium]|nr:phage holin family protein [Lentimicrobiaceae bacterium]MCB9023038.1 phage holin family protein [Lentimicrobiaceae bacterium]MCO5264562.1 phage holin family protein [Lentimicrobium sp.]
MRFILRMFISTCSVIITSYILPGVELESFFSAFSTALLIAFLNTIVKPLLIIFTIPVTLLTFGFFLLVINATIIMMASNLLNGFYVENFWYALIFSIILSAVNTVLSSMVASDSQPKA